MNAMNNIRFSIQYFSFVLMLCVFLLLSNPAAAAAAEITLTSAERAWLDKNPVIRARVANVPPYHFWDNGPHGFSVDLLEHIAAEAGLRVEYLHHIPWSTALRQIENRDLDVLLTAKATPERARFLNFSDNYLELPWMIFSTDKNDHLATLVDLFGKTIAIEKSYVLQKMLARRYPQIQQILVKDAGEALLAVSAGQADAYLGNLPIAQYYIGKMGLLNLKVTGKLDFDVHTQAFAVRKDWPELVSILNKGLVALPEAQRNEIQRQYYGVELQVEKPKLTITEEQRAWLDAHPSLRFCFAPGREPYEFVEDKQPKGIFPDYLRLFAQRAGIQATPVFIDSWQAAQAAVKQGRCDVLSGAVYTSAREHFLHFTKPYLEIPQVLLATADKPFVADLEDLAGKRIGLLAGSVKTQRLPQQYPQIEWIEGKTNDTLFALLHQDRLHAVVTNLSQASRYTHVAPQDYKIIAKTGFSHRVSVAVRKDWPQLVAIFNALIDTLSQAEHSAIQQQWQGYVVHTRVNYTMLWQVTSVALLIIALMIYWNRKLAHAQAQLRDGKQHYQSLINAMNEGVITHDYDGRILTCNPAAAQTLGIHCNHLLGTYSSDPQWRVIHEDGSPWPGDSHPAMITLRTGKAQRDVLMGIYAPDDSLRWLQVNTAPIYRDGVSAPCSVVATFTDITEKRIIQQQLDLVNNQRTAILANSNAAIAIFKQRRFVEVNTYMAALFGYRPEQLIGQSTRLLHCDDAHYAEFGQHLYSRLAQNHHCALEYAFRHRDGHTVWLYLSVSRLMPDAPADEIALVGVDITERRQMEHVLREERATTQRYLDTMQTVILALDIVGNITMLNRAGCKLLGYTAEEIIGQNWFETCLPQPEGWKVVYPMFKQAIEGCLKGAEYFENAIRRRDGVQHLMAWHNTYLYDNDGVVTGVLCAGENISARKATEHALHQAMQQREAAEQFARAVIDALSAHLCVVDANGVVLTVNRAWRAFADANPPAPPNYGIGSSYISVCESCENAQSVMAREFATQLKAVLNGEEAYFQYEYPCHASQTQRWFVAYVTRFYQGDEIRAVIAHENITERKRAENALHASEARYRRLIETMAEGVIMQNQDGEIIECNAAAEQILGLNRDQMMGRTSIDPRWQAIHEDGSLFPGDRHPAPMALQTGEVQSNVVFGVHKPDGDLRWLNVNAVPLFHHSETTPYAAVATFSDITTIRDSRVELERQRSTLQAVLDHAPVAIQVFATDATPRISNHMAAQLLGRKIATDATLNELNQAYNVFIYGTYTLYPIEKMPLTRALHGQTSMVEDMELHRPDDSKVLLQVIAAPIRETGGDISGAVVIFQDISARKQAELTLQQSNAQLEMVLQSTAVGIWDWNIASGAAVFSERWAQIVGYTLAELQPVSIQTWRNNVHPDDLPASEHALQAYWRGETEYYICEVRVKHKDGHWVWVLDTGKSVAWDANGKPLRMIGTHIDISAHKQAEEDLIHAREAAEAANQAKSAFLANMSHELRTPLNAVLGFAQVVRDAPELAPSLQGHIDKIHRGGDYLLTLINDILDLSKVEAGRIELYPEEIKVAEFFEDISDMFRFRAEQKGLAFYYRPDASLPQCLYADVKRLRQVVLNLLGNAIKFTEQGQVSLDVGYHNGYLALCVKDTGIGIAADTLQSIFRPFAQTGENRYKSQGTGLGLSITDKIVTLMGGEISVDSELGQGSHFQAQIPLEAGFAHPAAETEDDAQQTQVVGYRRTDSPDDPLRLLVVDDIADNREVLSHMLSPLGFTVYEANSGEACLQQARQIQPDAVLMDMRMPGMDGLETMQQLHMQADLSDLPVIIVSASVYFKDRKTALNKGSVAYLNKPVKRRTLLQTLQQHLPLNWVTSDANSPAAAESVDFSAAWLDALEHAVLSGNRRDIWALLDELKQPQGVSLPPKLQAWVDDYKYMYILEWIKQIYPEQE